MGRPPAYNEEQLLHTLIDCLWVQGYAATPISELVQRTGVNAASLYGRFGSKKGIMLAAIDTYAQETIAGLDSILASETTAPKMIQAILEHAVASFDDPAARGCFLVNSLSNVSEDMPEFTQAVTRYMEQIRTHIAQALANSPDLRPDLTPEEAALFVQTQVWGLKLMTRMRPTKAMGQVVIRQTLVALFTDSAVQDCLHELREQA